MDFNSNISSIDPQIKVTFGRGFSASSSRLKKEICSADLIGLANESPLVVSVAEACRLLSLGRTSVFELMKTGELASFRSGRRRLIPRQSVFDYIDKQLAAERTDPA